MMSFLMQTTGGENAPQWIAIAIGVLGLAYIVMRPKFGRKKDPLENPGPRISLSQQRSLERDMSNLVVELSDMARQITAQLDTRAAKLEALLAEADERIAELRRLNDRATASPATREEREPTPSTPEPQAAEEPVDPRHVAVYALADEGLSAQAIAQRLGRPSGEIELILALRPAQRAG
jgi:hypothetical protein